MVEGVKKRITELTKSGLIPEEMQVVPTTDESVFIQNAVNNVVSSGLAGTILAGLTVFVFLGSLRQTFIITLAIPLSTLVAIICMKLFGLFTLRVRIGGKVTGTATGLEN